jgi:hypothetical protein
MATVSLQALGQHVPWFDGNAGSQIAWILHTFAEEPPFREIRDRLIIEAYWAAGRGPQSRPFDARYADELRKRFTPDGQPRIWGSRAVSPGRVPAHRLLWR